MPFSEMSRVIVDLPSKTTNGSTFPLWLKFALRALCPLPSGSVLLARELLDLLLAYSGVNVAAISGLSENTVRTYVRRLYQKLGVSNRADLVRKLMSPAEAKSSAAPSSVISPPPDSSLVDGDDTLD